MRPTATASVLRAPLALCAALVALAPAGCVRSRREVMLIVTTNIACPAIDRITVRLSRGAGSTAYTWQRTFALTGEGCSTTSNVGMPVIPLSTMADYRLGIVDSLRTDERVRIEVEGLGLTGVRSVAETDFVDDKVYAVPVDLSSQCQTFDACASGFVCRVPPGTAQAACGSIYRTPGTLGTFTASMALTAHDTVEMGP